MQVRSACRALYRAAAVLLTTAVAGGSMTMLGATAAHADPSSPSGWCSASWSSGFLNPGGSSTLSVSTPGSAYGMTVIDGHLVHTGASRGYDSLYPGQSQTWDYVYAANVLAQFGATTPTLGIRIYSSAAHSIDSITDATPDDCETSITLDQVPHPVPQTVTIDPVGPKLLSDRSVTVNATSDSGDMLVQSDTPNVCSWQFPTTTFTLRSPGLCTLRADARGNYLYLPGSATISFWVAGPQTVTIAPIAAHRLGDSPVNVTASSTSGLPVTLSSTTTSKCTVTGNAVTLVDTGTCTVQADATVDDAHLAATAQTSFTIGPALLAQTVTIDPISSHRLGDNPVNVTAASTSELPVTLSSTTLSECTVTGNAVTLLDTGTCTVKADAAGNSTYLPGTTQTSFTIGAALLAQTVTIDPISSHRLGDNPVNVTAASTSELPVTLSSTTLSKCTVTGNAVTLLDTGTCTLKADAAGNSTYLPGTTQTSFTIGAALLAQTVTIDPISSHRLGDNPVNVTAASTSELPVTLSSTTLSKCTVTGNAVTLLDTGTCTLKADAAGNSTYLPGTTQTSFTIGAAPTASTLHLTGPAGVALSTGQITVRASSTSPLLVTTVTTTPSVCTLSGSTVRLRAAGTCTLRATQPGDADHLAPAPATLSFPVWAGPALPNTGRLTQVLTALGQGENALRVAGTGGACVTASGGRVVLTKPGTCTILVRNAGGGLVRAHRTQVTEGKPAAGLRQSATVFFSFNSAALTADGKRALAAAVPALRHSSLVVVYGHTDGPAGNSPSSMTLSTQRASAVASFLRSAGVGAHFELVPLAHLAPTGKDAAKNRRAEVFYLPPVS